MCEREPSGFPFAFNQGKDCSLVQAERSTHQTEKDARRRLFLFGGSSGTRTLDQPVMSRGL